MKIQYLGHSSFLLVESTGTRIITDPHKGVGYQMPTLSADVVTMSHSHEGHSNFSAIKGKHIDLSQEGIHDHKGVKISAFKSFHDNENGTENGENLIYKFRMDGIEICHLGDIGQYFEKDMLEMLLPVNVLLIPVGGGNSLDSEQAMEYVEKLMPEIVIPMHYKTKSHNKDLDKVDDFLSYFDDEQILYLEENTLELTRDDLDDETKVYVMKRMK